MATQFARTSSRDVEMLKSEGRDLARRFYQRFMELFEQEFETDKAAILPDWMEKSRWTDRMLNKDSGFLGRVSKEWAEPLNVPSTTKNEWMKFDLMLVDIGSGKEWWESVPIITIEHENDNGIHDEVWKLACWKSRLKVLITYHDNSAQAEEKREKAARIIKNIEDGYNEDGAEWLMLSAPRTWVDRLGWVGHEWRDACWRAL